MNCLETIKSIFVLPSNVLSSLCFTWQVFAPFYPPTMLQAWTPTTTCYDLSTVFTFNGLTPHAAFKPVQNDSSRQSYLMKNQRKNSRLYASIRYTYPQNGSFVSTNYSKRSKNSDNSQSSNNSPSSGSFVSATKNKANPTVSTVTTITSSPPTRSFANRKIEK